MVAMEFKDTAQGLPQNINQLVQNACMERNLLTLTTSIYPVLRLIPALVLSEADVDEMLETMAAAVKEVAESVQKQ